MVAPVDELWTDSRRTTGGTVAVAAVSFAVERAEILGALGRNSAGKTTVVECIAGLRRPDRGRVSVLGQLWALGVTTMVASGVAARLVRWD